LQTAIEEVQQFAGTNEFADDVCLIALEFKHPVKDSNASEFLRPSLIPRP
jgi:hypothetical protein